MKTCYPLIHVECRGLFIDKLQTSRRAASIVCHRERPRDAGGDEPWPAAIRAGSPLPAASPFRIQARGQPRLPTPASRTAPNRNNTMPDAGTAALPAQGNLAGDKWKTLQPAKMA